MQNIPDVWIGALSAIAGGVLVGIFALIVKVLELRDKRISDDRNIMREKLGELYYRCAELEKALLKVAVQSGKKGSDSFDDSATVMLEIESILREKIMPLTVIFTPTILESFHALQQSASNYCAALVGELPENDFVSLAIVYSTNFHRFQDELISLIRCEGVAPQIRNRRFGRFGARWKQGGLVTQNSQRRRVD